MFQPTILRFESIDSTNLEAMRQAKTGAPEGFCVVAREQTSGRGRLNRSWQSTKDAGLYFSIVLRPSFEMGAWPLISLMAGLAASDALAKACGVRVDIKWPNDLLARDRKLGGILAETIDTAIGAGVVVGIGINLIADSLPEAMRDSSTSVESVTGKKPDQERVLQELIEAIRERYPLLDTSEGREHTIREWCANSSFAFDRAVRVSLAGDVFTGVTRGLESDGALRVETNSGEIKCVRAGDVTALRAYSPEI